MFVAFPAVEIVEGDMSRPETLTEALSGVDRVLLISSPDEKMVETQCVFIDAAKTAGVQHIVKFSGTTTALNSPFLFSKMHAEIERYLENSGLAWTHLRPAQFMQEYLREVPTIVGHGALFLPLAGARVVGVDIEDVAKAAFVLLTTAGHEGKVYNITGPEALSMTEIAEQISRAIGRTVKYVPVSREQRKQALLGAGIPPYVVDALDVQAVERMKGGIESVVQLETHKQFGIPVTTFAEFARRNAEAFLGQSSSLELSEQTQASR
jgi:uncharacterized protein YbjT (DUF2867 family)